MPAYNTIPYKSVWVAEYMRTWYKNAVFPMFADMRFEKDLPNGATIKWSYDADMTAQQIGADGSFTISARTVTDETLTADQRPGATFFIPMTEKIQDHRPTQQKWAQKSMNVVYQDMDGKILGQLAINATSSVDAGDLGGSSGTPVTISSGNAAAIYAAARQKLRNQNVIYDENTPFTGVTKLDSANILPVAAIPAELEAQLLLQLGFKNTELGDTTIKRGFLGLIFGFNTVVSTSLPFSVDYALSATATDASTVTIGSGSTTVGSGTAVLFTFETGTIDDVGEVKAETSATVSMTNLINSINNPYSSLSAKYYGFTRSSMSVAQQRILDNLYGVDNGDGTGVIYVFGQGAISITQTDTNGTLSKQTVHALIGTSKSIAVVMQKEPNLQVSAGNVLPNGASAGNVGQQFVTWAYAGWKVFTTQKRQMVDVKIDASSFSAPASVLY